MNKSLFIEQIGTNIYSIESEADATKSRSCARFCKQLTVDQDRIAYRNQARGYNLRIYSS